MILEDRKFFSHSRIETAEMMTRMYMASFLPADMPTRREETIMTIFEKSVF